MAMANPVRLVESSRGTKWPSSEDAATFGSRLESMAAEELGLIMKEHSLHRHQADLVPNRSGSAPPNMEGSFAAIRNLLNEKNFSMNSSLDDLRNSLENIESEEQVRSSPAYLAYYFSNMNLNVRLPPPLISKENRHLLHQTGIRKDWKLTSMDDSGNKSFHFSQGLLSTYREVTEEDISSAQASEDLIENNTAAMLGMNNVSSSSRHKSLVDLIQEDFPRTPSPVYNQSRSSSHAADEHADYDMRATLPNIMSVNKLPEPNSGSMESPEINSLDPHSAKLIPSDVAFSSSFPSSWHPEEIRTPQRDESSDKYVKLDDNASINGTFGLDTSIIESRADLESKRNREEQQSYGKNVPKLPLSIQQANSYQVQGIHRQKIAQGSHPNFSVDVQQSLHLPGFTPPLYATTTAYMASGNPFYTNLQPSSLHAPQYSLGGYPLDSTLVPPFMAGYPSHGALPVPFNANSSPNFTGRTAGVSSGEGIPHMSDVQHQSKFYGQHRSISQPSFMNPFHMQYYPHASHDIYGSSSQHGQLASRGFIGSPFTQQESTFSAYMGEQKFQSLTNGSLSISTPRKLGSSGSGDPPFLGVMTQFPASPVASPIMPSSPIGGTSHLGRQCEMRFPQVSIRNPGIYSGWQGKRAFNTADDSKKLSFLEELKSSNPHKLELSDIEGRIVEFSVDQHGSRFIQQKLEHCSAEEKASVFKEIVPHASKLMIDVFGNYVIQKFFEHGSAEQRKQLANQLSGQMLTLSLQMYGCRVIQKALEVIELDQKTLLVQELDGHVMKCVRDQNGNHVIQKCIECIPTEKIGNIISAFQGHVSTLATHPYGCRVIQRVLEHCSNDLQCQCVINEILESASILAQDQYGNYVTQHVLEKGKPHERNQIISKLSGRIVQMSMHKYASNVIEKCLEHGNTMERELLIEEILGQPEKNDNLLTMMKDQFANYVVQKIFEKSNDRQRGILLNRTRVHLQALRKYTYGKHIVARFEQLCGEESQTSEPEGA